MNSSTWTNKAVGKGLCQVDYCLAISRFFVRLDECDASMAVPRVVIVGRPNVGKSSIFNWLCGKRIAIVDDMAGVTRDRITMLVEHEQQFFEIVDTGGMGIEDADNLTKEVEQQINTGIEEADVILFVVDTKTVSCRWTKMWLNACAKSKSRSCCWPTRPTTMAWTFKPRSFTSWAAAG